MNDFIFENSTKVFFGKGAVKKNLAGLVEGYAGPVMLAYGGGSIKRNGIYDEVTETLRAAGKTIIEFPGIMPNPTYEKVLAGAELARESREGLVLGVGGGSVMDCCKAIAMAASAMAAAYEGDIWEDFFAREGKMDFLPLPVGVIVTASGTGSEVNGDAVITNTEKKVKTGRDYPRCNPDFAILDPVYTMSVPKRQLAAGGFDALSHIMEIYFSAPDEENVSDDIAEALMRGVVRDLRASMKDPEDYAARSNLMWEAAMAENRIIKLGKQKDFQAHMMEHQLGAFTDCGHGEGLAVIMPAYYRHIAPAGAKKLARFAVRVWGASPEGKTELALALDGIEALASFIRELGLPSTLRELGVSERAPLREIAFSTELAAGGYGRLSHEEVLRIFEECR